MRASNVPSCDSSLTEAMFSFIRLRISTCTHSTASCGVRAPSFDRTTLRDSPSFPQTTRCTPCSSTDTRYGSLKSVPRAAYRIGASLGVAPRGVAFCIIFCTLSPYVANFASVSSLTPPNASNSSSTQFLFPRLFASFAPRAVAIASKRAKIASLARFLVSRGDDADAFDAVASSGSARIDRVVQGARTGRRAATRAETRRAATRQGTPINGVSTFSVRFVMRMGKQCKQGVRCDFYRTVAKKDARAGERRDERRDARRRGGLAFDRTASTRRE